MGIGTRKVVLHKEDADEDGGTKSHHRGIDQPEGSGANPGRHAKPHRNHRQVVQQQIPKLLRAMPPAAAVGLQNFGPGAVRVVEPLLQCIRQKTDQASHQLDPRLDHKIEEAPWHQHERVAQPAVHRLATGIELVVSGNTHQGGRPLVHLPVSVMAMVKGVAFGPRQLGNTSHHTQEKTNPTVGSATMKQRGVAAVVHQGKTTGQEQHHQAHNWHHQQRLLAQTKHR